MSVSRETEGLHGVSRETAERLTGYVDLLLRWNRTVNLISRNDERQVWTRHVTDSLRLVPFIPTHTEVAIDLGSGGGLPGLVLAIATGVAFTLIEADSRKCAFLREAARVVGAPVHVANARIESAQVAPVGLITARALAPLDRLLALATPLLRAGGTLLLLKGATVEAEINTARQHWTMHVEHHISRTGGGVILRISEVARVGA